MADSLQGFQSRNAAKPLWDDRLGATENLERLRTVDVIHLCFDKDTETTAIARWDM